MLPRHYDNQEKYIHKDLSDYRKAAASFQKQIRLMDSKLQSIDNSNNNEGENCSIKDDRFVIGRNSQLKNYEKQVMSDFVKRQKHNAAYSLNPQSNMFKNTSSSQLQKKNGKQLVRLPTLEKKSIFHSQGSFEEQARPKYIKISVDKLIPLKPEDIKKKFELKYRMNNNWDHSHNLR